MVKYGRERTNTHVRVVLEKIPQDFSFENKAAQQELPNMTQTRGTSVTSSVATRSFTMTKCTVLSGNEVYREQMQ